MYLNDYYMVYDAAKEDHDVQIVQLKKAIHEYELETADPLISKLKEFRAALLTRFKILAWASKQETEKPLTKAQHQKITDTLKMIVLKKEVSNENDNLLICFDFI